MEKYSELARCVENIETDANKFFINGNKAAGTRARKHLQELKQLAQDLRVIIQNTKNEKSRATAASDAEQEMAQPPHSGFEDPAGQVGF